MGSRCCYEHIISDHPVDWLKEQTNTIKPTNNLQQFIDNVETNVNKTAKMESLKLNCNKHGQHKAFLQALTEREWVNDKL